MRRLLVSIVVLLCLTSVAVAASKKKKKVASSGAETEVTFDLDSCVDNAIDYRTLMTTNPYDNVGKCYWLGFPMVKTQLLSRSVALIGFAGAQQNVFALMDFGKESVPMEMISGLVMGMGAYEYQTVSGSVNIVHHLRKLDGYLKRTKSQQKEKDARDRKAAEELKEQAKRLEIKEAEYQKAAQDKIQTEEKVKQLKIKAAEEQKAAAEKQKVALDKIQAEERAKQLMIKAAEDAKEAELAREESKRKLAAKKVNLERNLGLEFIDIKRGCFQMGCEGLFNGCKPEEKPIHETCISDFKIGKFEITNRQWKMVMEDHASTKYMATDNRPVDNVQWKTAQEFISELNAVTGNKYRLPTEAEWEYACRSGGKDEKYCGGNDPDAVAWYSDNSRGKQGWSETHPVGQKQPNGLGIYDMSGNVAEWVQGCPSHTYKIGRQQDPQDLCKSSSQYFTPYYIYRGGNAELPERFLRSYGRNFSSGFESKVGLRLVAPIQ